MSKLEYKINSHNSTVCGYPGREFDWSKFSWNCEEYDVSIDNFFIEANCKYLHVPYDWNEEGTIYRVRPNESMRAGKVYRGHLIKKQTAIKKDDGWYWVLEY